LAVVCVLCGQYCRAEGCLAAQRRQQSTNLTGTSSKRVAVGQFDGDDTAFELQGEAEPNRRQQVLGAFKRKILFCAEPQMGKTGSYLFALKKLMGPGAWAGFAQGGRLLHIPLGRLRSGKVKCTILEGLAGGAQGQVWLDLPVGSDPTPLQTLHHAIAEQSNL